MSIPQKIPKLSRIEFPAAIFTAPLVAGQYDFGSVAANISANFMNLRKGLIYFIERINFSCITPEGVWLESIDPTLADVPRVIFDRLQAPGHSQYAGPIRCVNYYDNAEQNRFFEATAENDVLRISFLGIVTQVAGMVGVDPLQCQFSATVYEIFDQSFVDWYNSPDAPGMKKVWGGS